jgi:hypothetical protein
MENSTKMLLNASVMETDAVVTYLKTPVGDAVNTYVMADRIDTYGAEVWDSDAQFMSSYLDDKGYLDACVNNRNQVIAVWEDKRSDSDGDVYLQNINPNGSVGPLGPTTGTITGTVMDSSGTIPVVGCIVVNYDNLEQITSTDTTGASGQYGFTLPAGTYHETFEKTGYRDTSLTNIVVTAGANTNVSMLMNPSGGCLYILGDVNGNLVFNGIDVTYSVGYFKGGNVPPYSCNCNGTIWFVAGDVNGNCQFNGIDVTYMVSYFKGGLPPTPCPECPPAP